MSKKRKFPDGFVTAYCKQLGITQRKLRLLGGIEHLVAMDRDALLVMIKPNRYGNSREIHNGGLAARGMKFRVPDIITNPPETFQ